PSCSVNCPTHRTAPSGRCRSRGLDARSATSRRYPSRTRLRSWPASYAIAQMSEATPSALYDALWEEVYGDLQDLGPAHRHMARLMRRTLARIDYRTVLEVGVGFGHNLPVLTAGHAIDRIA